VTKVVFDPLSVPCKGMNASMNPLALPDGVWSLLQNVRIGNGVITRREGQEILTQDSTNKMKNGFLVAAKVLHMMDSGTSKPTLFTAVDDGSKIDVYYSTDFTRTDGNNVNFYQLTASSGQWGDTRLATGVKEVSFSVVKSPTRYGVAPFNTYSIADTDLVLVSDGDTTLVSPLTAGDARIVKETWRSDNLGTFKQEASFPYYFTMSDSGVNLTKANVTATTTVDDEDAVPTTDGLCPSLLLATGSVLGDGATITKASGSALLAASPQLNVVYHCPQDPYIWNRLKLILSDGSTTYTVFDGANSNYRVEYTSVDGSNGIWMATFQIDQSVVPQNTAVTAVQVKWNAATTTEDYKVFFIGIMGGGTIGGGASVAVSYYASGPFTESASIVCSGEGRGASLASCGVVDPLHHFQIPVNPAVMYAYNTFWEAPPQSPTDKTGYGSGLDYVLFYVRPYGGSTYALTASTTVASYAAGWSNTYTVGSTQKSVVTGTVRYPRQAPGEFHRPVPPHTCAVSANNRLYVGSPKFASTIGGTSVTNRSGYMWSKRGDCFSFSDNFDLFIGVDADQSAAGRAELNGHRPCALIVASQSRSTLQVSDPLVIGTDKGAYVADTRDVNSLLSPTLVTNYGSKCPGSFCVGNGAVYYFDTNRQIRRLTQGIDSPSRWRVDALWNGIPTSNDTSTYKTFPRDKKVSCEFWDGKLYVAYTPTSYQANNGCSVYDTELDVWYDDAVGLDMERMVLTPIDGDKDQLRFVTVGDQSSPYTVNPKLVWHEKPNTASDGATVDIVFNIVTGYLHEPDFIGKEFSQMGVICSNSGAGVVLTASRTGIPLGTSSTGRLSVSDVGYSYSYKWDVTSQGNRTGVYDSAVKYGLSGTTYSGFTVYSIVIDIGEGGESVLVEEGGKNG